MPTIIELTPACARNARSPPTPRYRHNVRIANQQFPHEFLKSPFAAKGFRMIR
jgi:hypothetical protein